MGPLRIQRADRTSRLDETTLDEALDADHPVRAMAAFIEQLDLSAFYRGMKTFEGASGRPPVDPAILLTLWAWGTACGVGSARQLDELSKHHLAYRWICGGVTVNYHLLAAFRVEHGEEFDALLTRLLAALVKQGLVKLQRLSQDGTRIRASAGAASFRRESTLDRCLVEARDHLETLKAQLRKDPTSFTRAQRAARLRAATERQARVEAALSAVPELRAAREHDAQANKRRAEHKEDEVRVSATDAQARVMKMPDGGFRPAYNIQFVADVKTDVVVGTSTSNAGRDTEQLTPALEDAERRTGVTPAEYLVDGAFVTKDNLQALEDKGITAYAPVPPSRKEGVDPYTPKPSDTQPLSALRKRMARPKAKDIYKQRAATSERINAEVKTQRGLSSFTVRGKDKVHSVALLAVLAYDILRCLSNGWSLT